MTGDNILELMTKREKETLARAAEDLEARERAKGT